MKQLIRVAGIDVDVVRKDIKNLHIGVYPPNGRVRVAAPLLVDDDAVRLAVVSKLSWIKRRRTNFQEQARQSRREYVLRESHYFLGQRYLINVVEHTGRAKVEIRPGHLDLYVAHGSDMKQRERVLVEWYRKELKQMIPQLIEKWEPIIGVHVADWGVKRMKTKWGSCNREARRIWLNLELAKKPIECIEYVIVHEMVHILVRLHNEEFVKLMDEFMPKWRLYRDELNRAPLGYETWLY